jgi:hypothetical protein
MIDGTVGYANSMDSVFKTTDGGNHWKALVLPVFLYLSNLCFTNRDEGIVFGRDGIILYTKDGGNSWIQVESGTNLYLYTASFPTRDTGYIAGRDGIILSIKNGTHMSIHETGTVHDDQQSFLYPNPSDGLTTIRFNAPLSSVVSLTIFDITGREIKKIRYRKFPTGEQTITFSSSDLYPGIYIYRLTIGNTCETGKFIRE